MILAGKVVVVTGAGGGIGKHLCRELLDLGARVWALDLDEMALGELELSAKKWGNELFPLKVDVSDKNALQAAMSTIVEKHTAVEIWINNAGISGLGDFQSSPLEKSESVIQVNLMGTIYGTRVALDHMETMGRGMIVNIASVAGHVAAPYLAAYSASKHGVIGFTRALRQELALKNSNTHLLIISPGFVDTAMIEKGTKAGFPDWLGFALSSPEKVATEIIRSILKKDTECCPTLNGKMILKLNRVLPGITARTSRILLAKNIRDVIFLRKQPPK